MELIKDFFIVDENVELENIRFFPIFDLMQCSVCKKYILTFAGANYKFHVAKDHYGDVNKINTISLEQASDYSIDIYYPKEIKRMVDLYLGQKSQLPTAYRSGACKSLVD